MDLHKGRDGPCDPESIQSRPKFWSKSPKIDADSARLRSKLEKQKHKKAWQDISPNLNRVAQRSTSNQNSQTKKTNNTNKHLAKHGPKQVKKLALTSQGKASTIHGQAPDCLGRSACMLRKSTSHFFFQFETQPCIYALRCASDVEEENCS